jgi:protein TonB
MGNLTMPEYECLDGETLPDKTQVGGVKHNEGMGLEITGLGTGKFLLVPQTERPEATEPAATMPNDLLIQTDTESQAAAAIADGVELDLSFGVPVEDKPIWADLYESIRDIFFPPKLPPLELTSTPIPVPDRMAVKRNPWAVGASTVLNGGILVLLLFAVVKPMIDQKKPPTELTPIDLTDYKAPKSDVAAGGGGGSPDKIEAIKGRIPPRMTTPDVAPKIEQPPLPSIDVQKDIAIPDNPNLVNFGVSNSANVKLDSGGNGSGMGLGPGYGNGYGPGYGGNIGGGLERVGGAVSQPIPLNDVQAEFSDEARRAKYQGIVLISVIVDVQGNPQNPRVVRALGMGLDEKALEAVRKYKFKPAMKNGKPVPVMINVQIDFHLY